MLTLRRAYLPSLGATWGELELEGRKFATLELPWRGNRVRESCIPEGVYTMRRRASSVVERASGGTFSTGWEIRNVRGREYIMLHPGNTVADTDGCILVGEAFAIWSDDVPAVTNSRAAFAELMEVLGTRAGWNIDVRCNCPSWP